MPPPDRTVISSHYLHRAQRRHFILFDVLPFLGTLLAVARLFSQPIGGANIALFAVMWLLTGLGLTVGYTAYSRTARSPRPLQSLPRW